MKLYLVYFPAEPENDCEEFWVCYNSIEEAHAAEQEARDGIVEIFEVTPKSLGKFKTEKRLVKVNEKKKAKKNEKRKN